MIHLNKNKLLYFIFVSTIFSFFIQSCAPVFSEMQSARTVGKNRIEFTPSFSSVSMTSDGNTEGVQNHLGLQAAYGLTSKLDLRARYERIWLKDDGIGDGVSVFGIGPKYSLLENKIAFYLPVGRALSEDTNDTWELQPTVLLTLPAIQDKLDITLSPKYLMTFCEKCDDLVAVNLGVSISTNLNKWSIRPEYGMLFNPGEEGYFSHFSIGFSAALGRE